MPGITTILTTAAATVGVVAAVRHIRKKIGHMEEVINQARKKAEGKVDSEVLEFEKNPETGAYEAKDV